MPWTSPWNVQAVNDSFYVDDGLTGADSVDQAVQLHHQLQSLFGKGGFTLRKWDSNEPEVLQQIDPELREQKSTHTISDPDEYLPEALQQDLGIHDSWREPAKDVLAMSEISVRLVSLSQ